jgi:3-oxoacyl-[acyl-carrier protein] reductase
MPSALITGVGRPNGIAAAIVRLLAADGWKLGIHHFDEDPSDVLAGIASAVAGVQHEDLGDPAAPARLFDGLQPAAGPFDALILVHTRCVPADLLATSAEEMDRHWAVNVRAALLLIQEFARRLKAPTGRIIAFTSDHFTPTNLAYGSTKAALDRVVLAAAHELGPQGIRANAINPGPTDTGWTTPEIYSDAEGRTPLGRVSMPEDAARLVKFLLSEDGSWITGQILNSNGGFRLGV